MKHLRQAILWTVQAAIGLLAALKRLRQAILWTVLATIGLVAALSIVGAFLGAERAKDFFNSAPLVVFWFILLALLAAGFIFFRRLVATPAGLAMHLGTFLVVAGAMWGSDQGHALRTQYLPAEESASARESDLYRARQAFGLVGDKVPAGFMVLYKGRVSDRILAGDLTHRLATSPVSLGLDDFRIEYYLADDPHWGLIVIAAIPDADGNPGPEHQALVHWQVGETAPIPYTRVRLKVLQYLDHARAAPDGGAVADPASPLPAIQILLEYQDRQRQAWLVPEPDETAVRLPLGPFIRNEPAKEGDDAGPELYFVAPVGAIKGFISDVTVIEGDQPVAEATIKVNHPLHWGGYHFYQYDYDKDDGSYSILQVVSDSGLWAVYLGLFLLVTGAFGRFWLEPAWARLFPGGSDGH